ncbi:MAG: RIP metalloprotease RseP [Lachnospiraceae bacterium]|nr:RIP metalloprotease RseP [Lachnospiraceae bacterium]
MKWIIAIIIFSVLVLFHEFGHFIVAKMSGVDVVEFSMGFGPRIFSFVRNGTRYSLKALLFGGSCEMKGMYDSLENEEEDRNLEPEEGAFGSVSIGKRIAIIFAGPFFNFILAFVGAFLVISVVGYDPADVAAVQEGSPAAEAGLMAGDTITSFMGDRVDIGRDISNWFTFHDLTEEDMVTVSFLRDGEEKSLSFAPYVYTRYMLGLTYHLDSGTALVEAVGEGSPLEEAGVKAGDVIISINGKEITTARSLQDYFEEFPMDGSEITLTVDRDGQEITVSLIPYESKNVLSGFSYNLGRVSTTPLGVIKYSAIELRYWITTVIRSLGGLFTGRFGADDFSGPVGVVDIVGTTYEEVKDEGLLMTLMNMINLVVLLSANLGVMNLLPIPALDGGRLVFLFYELISGRPVNQKVEITIQSIAVAALLLFMVYVMYHDLLRIFAR